MDKMNILDTGFIRGFIRMADDGWNEGWHERNGGNLSYRIKPEEIEQVKKSLSSSGAWLPIGTSAPQLAGEYFLMTGTGKYFSNIMPDPESNIGIIELDASGENYRIVWGFNGGARPSSELPTHIMNHEVKKSITGGKHRVIYHCHPANIIALTFVLPLEDKVFTRQLWEMMTECPIIFPEGIGVLRWMVPGNREIAEKTSRLMEKYNAVVWAHHGIFCSGEDYDQTFGLTHTIEKAAQILVKVLSIRQDKLQTITAQEFRMLSGAFNIKLSEEFLK
jgi:rhamnulose-1-phosphate aldolase